MAKTTAKLVATAAVVLIGLQLVAPVLASEAARATIGSGTLKSKSGDTLPAVLVVTREGKDYTVNIDANTQLRRRFFGRATLAEIQIGDTLNVVGLWTDEAHTTVSAKLIRDISIQKRFGAFVGEVTAVTASGWTMNTVHRGAQTVRVSSATKFTNRQGKAITQDDIKLGHRVRVKGLWDNKLNTISEVAQVKNYSL